MPQQQECNAEERWTQVAEPPAALEPNTPVIAVEAFSVIATREPEFKEKAEAYANLVRTLSGCIDCSAYLAAQFSTPDAVEYQIRQQWTGAELFRSHWASGDRQQFSQSIRSLIGSDPELKLYVTGADSDVEFGNLNDFYSLAFRLSMAMSLFGMQQLAGFLSPSTSSRSLRNVGKAVEAELNQSFRTAFRAGQTLQKGMFELASGGSVSTVFDPGTWMRRFSSFMQPGRQEDAPTQAPFASSGPQGNSSFGAQTANPSPATGSSQIRMSGWGPMPPEAVASAQYSPRSNDLQAQVAIGESDISSDFPFQPRYCEVYGSRIHYVDEGQGETILLLHGNPSWSYCWRNVIPHLSCRARCVAPDLIGYGRSDKPSIDYNWFDHVRYLEKFIENMGLRHITLVLHDQGSALGFHYAMRHEDNVRAIAFFEALVRPFTWENFSNPEFRELFRQFRTGGKGGLGWRLIVEENIFIEKLLPQATGRPLSEREMNFYREPFRYRPSRLPIWQFPNQTAIGGEPRDVWDAVTEYSNQLQRSDIPKLMLYAKPGALLTEEHVQWCQQNIKNLKSVDIGPGLHFLEESSPHRIGSEVAAWAKDLKLTTGRKAAGKGCCID